MPLVYTAGNPEPPAFEATNALDALTKRTWVYLPDQELKDAVNVSLLLEQPLLLTGEPGSGKTQLAAALANEFGFPLLKFETKSTTIARDVFYTYNAMARFHDKDGKRPATDFITYNALGTAILWTHPEKDVAKFLGKGFLHRGPTQSVVLIDEVDKAPRDFPNDILNEIEQKFFRIAELDNEMVECADLQKPIIVITSNSEKQLPDAFLRRCVYYDIDFPMDRLADIIDERLGQHIPKNCALVRSALELFYELRKDKLSLRKKPGTAELLSWLVALKYELGTDSTTLQEHAEAAGRTISCLLKTADDRNAAVPFIRQWLQPKKS